MTTTANKGTNRAAAAARTKRHAQRTPLPGDTARPVRGNPTAEAIKDELSKPKPRRKSAASKQTASAQPAPAARTNRTFGDATEGLSAQVKDQRDAGSKWYEIAAALGLGEGKTGCSRARRLYRLANEGAPAPRSTTAKATRAAKPKRVLVMQEDGTAAMEDLPAGDGGVPMQTEVRTWHLAGRDTRRGAGKQRMKPINISPVGEQQVRSLTAIFTADGYTITALRHQVNTGCCAT